MMPETILLSEYLCVSAHNARVKATAETWCCVLLCRYIKLDADLPNVLLDMKESGKTLLLITNSDWPYTSTMMEFAYNRCVRCDFVCAVTICLLLGAVSTLHTVMFCLI